LTEAGCELADVVKAMVWLRDRSDFPGFNAAFAEYFPTEPPAPPRFLINCLSTYEWN
jgi:2-iminobutanoate/2-iminopropanoate deaminase